MERKRHAGHAFKECCSDKIAAALLVFAFHADPKVTSFQTIKKEYSDLLAWLSKI
ncbi:MAG: hypothetical protein AB1468_06775 [Candidatus Micrarchaeota archaeon]